MNAGAPCDILAIDRSGRTVLDVAAGYDKELMQHMLLNCNLKPADALFHATKYGDTRVAEVGPRTYTPNRFQFLPKFQFSVMASDPGQTQGPFHVMTYCCRPALAL